MKKIPSKKVLSAGLITALGISFLLYKIWGAAQFGIGLAWGLSIVYIGLFTFLVFPGHVVNKTNSAVSVMNYLIKSGIRITIMLTLFIGVVFWFKINSLGLMIGAFAGLMGLTFYFLYQMKFNS